jgi:hypothetical protein
MEYAPIPYILPTRELRMRKKPNDLYFLVRDHTCKNPECERRNGVHHVPEDGPCKACWGKNFYCRIIPQRKLCPRHEEKRKRKTLPIPWFRSMFRNIEVDLEITPAQECNRPDVPQEWLENCKKPGKLVEHHRKFPVVWDTQSSIKGADRPKLGDDWDVDWIPTPAPPVLKRVTDSDDEDWDNPSPKYDPCNPSTWTESEKEWFEIEQVPKYQAPPEKKKLTTVYDYEGGDESGPPPKTMRNLITAYFSFEPDPWSQPSAPADTGDWTPYNLSRSSTPVPLLPESPSTALPETPSTSMPMSPPPTPSPRSPPPPPGAPRPPTPRPPRKNKRPAPGPFTRLAQQCRPAARMGSLWWAWWNCGGADEYNHLDDDAPENEPVEIEPDDSDDESDEGFDEAIEDEKDIPKKKENWYDRYKK